jgi:hypothetical protein
VSEFIADVRYRPREASKSVLAWRWPGVSLSATGTWTARLKAALAIAPRWVLMAIASGEMKVSLTAGSACLELASGKRGTNCACRGDWVLNKGDDTIEFMSATTFALRYELVVDES